jgi:AraC-like DNA-binding protein
MSNLLVQRMVDVIENEYAEVVTLRRLSVRIGRQSAYLGRLFRRETGASVRDYLTRVRLEHATGLIREGVKIEAVALSVGYRSKKNFYQQFKRHYGTTPVPYRLRPGDMDQPVEPRRHTAYCPDAGHEIAGATDTGSRPLLELESFSLAEPEPVLGQLSTMVRASNRAWRLAVRIQKVLATRYPRSLVPMLLTGDDGRYVAANPAAILLTGYSVVELQALRPGALFCSAPTGDTRCAWQLLLCAVHRGTATTNAILQSKAGGLIRIRLVTLKNWLWGSPDIAGLLAALPVPQS